MGFGGRFIHYLPNRFADYGCCVVQVVGIVIDENMRGLASPQLKQSYVLGMLWFIFSEVMFFACFFGALFYVRVLVNSGLVVKQLLVGLMIRQPMRQPIMRNCSTLVMKLRGRR